MKGLSSLLIWMARGGRVLALLVWLAPGAWLHAASPEELFNLGCEAYKAGRFEDAVKAFQFSAARQPATGTLLNLGNAEWQRGRTGEAILAWERAYWLNPFERAATGNLLYGRKIAQLDSPRLAWYEAASTWLPAHWWAWVTGLSLWLAVASGLLPVVLRRPRAAWHQALAACCLAIFLLSLPAQAGIFTRGRIGFILEKEAPLRLTPTTEAQWITRLGAGEPVRVGRVRGGYVFVETSRGGGWLQKDQVARIAPANGQGYLDHWETKRADDSVE